MEIEFTSSFIRDTRRLRNPELQVRIERTIEELEQAAGIEEIAGAARLRGPGQHYRIRIGDYRVGLSVENGKAVVTRFMHRRDIYRYFP